MSHTKLALAAIAVAFFAMPNQAEAQNYTRGGAIAGAIIGGIAGAQDDRALGGAVIGGLVGGVAGRAIDNSQRSRYNNAYGYQRNIYNYQPNYGYHSNYGYPRNVYQGGVTIQSSRYAVPYARPTPVYRSYQYGGNYYGRGGNYCPSRGW